MFGVCLPQCIGEVFVAVVRAPEVVHGKTSSSHTGGGVFEGCPTAQATRYHSLVVERSTLPDVLEVRRPTTG